MSCFWPFVLYEKAGIEMFTPNMLVLDANILVRAVLGQKVRKIIISYHEKVHFFTPEVCFEDAEKYLPVLLEKRNVSSTLGLNVISFLREFVQSVDVEIYKAQELSAKKRIVTRDINDWPIVATALVLNCPIWTEDQDFFGSGLATWTTDRIPIFLEDMDERLPLQKALCV